MEVQIALNDTCLTDTQVYNPSLEVCEATSHHIAMTVCEATSHQETPMIHKMILPSARSLLKFNGKQLDKINSNINIYNTTI